MLRVRVIPTLLLRDTGLVKGSKFANHKYVGDPVNAVKIFNEKEVDELVFLDINARDKKTGPNFAIIEDIASEAFIPFAYGGGISKMEEIYKLFRLGVEKVVLNSSAYHNPELISEAAGAYGSQSVVVSIDVRKTFFGKYEVYIDSGKTKTKLSPTEFAKQVEALGAGELIVCAIDREGTGKGYDCSLLKQITEVVDIPVVASGGAGSIEHFAEAVEEGGVAAVSAGDMFTFHGKHKAVLITYSKYEELEHLFKTEVSHDS